MKTLPLWVPQNQKDKMLFGEQTQLRLPIQLREEKVEGARCVASVGDIIEIEYQQFEYCQFRITSLKRDRLQNISFSDWCKWVAPDSIPKEKALATNVGYDYQIKYAKDFVDNAYGAGTWDKNQMCDIVEFVKIK